MIIAPIDGLTALRVGLTTTMTDATAGGTWSSSNTGIVSIDPSTGIATAVSIGYASIIYTVGSNSIAQTINIYQNSISNGFDLARIFPAFQGRLGWHSSYDTTVPALTSNNLSATSGRYYDRGFHKAVTVKNYFDTQENPSIDAPSFNQLLQDEDQAVITRCVNAIFNKPQLLEHSPNYTRTANIRNINIPNQGQACGYRINVAPGSYAVVINNIGLFFNETVTFNMYLFNDLILAPVYTKSVTAIANSQTIVNMEWAMNYINTQYDGKNIGGVWYLLYFQNDLGSAQAIDEQLNLWTDSKIYGAYPFQAPQVGGLNFTRINPSVNFRSYGFNMEVSVYRDYTQKIVENAPLFDEARGLCMAINCLEQIKYSARINDNQSITKLAIDGMNLDVNSAGPNDTFPFIAGLKKQLEREFYRLGNNFWQKPEAVSVPIGNADWTDERYYEGMDINALPSRENAY